MPVQSFSFCFRSPASVLGARGRGPEFEDARFQTHQMHIVLQMHLQDRRAVLRRECCDVFERAQASARSAQPSSAAARVARWP